MRVVGAEGGDDVFRHGEAECPPGRQPPEEPREAEGERHRQRRHCDFRGRDEDRYPRALAPEQRQCEDEATQQDGRSQADQRGEERDDAHLDREERPDSADRDAPGSEHRELPPPAAESDVETDPTQEDGERNRRDREGQEPEAKESGVVREVSDRTLEHGDAPSAEVEVERGKGRFQQGVLALQARVGPIGIVGIHERGPVEPHPYARKRVIRVVEIHLGFGQIGNGEEDKVRLEVGTGRRTVEAVDPPD